MILRELKLKGSSIKVVRQDWEKRTIYEREKIGSNEIQLAIKGFANSLKNFLGEGMDIQYFILDLKATFTVKGEDWVQVKLKFQRSRAINSVLAVTEDVSTELTVMSYSSLELNKTKEANEKDRYQMQINSNNLYGAIQDLEEAIEEHLTSLQESFDYQGQINFDVAS